MSSRRIVMPLSAGAALACVLPAPLWAASLESQLRAGKDGTRKNAVMNAIGSQLSADEIANPVAPKAAREGKALPDGAVLFAEVHSAKLDADKKPIAAADGLFVPDQLLFYTAMQRESGWGQSFPDLLRNEDWNYAIFTTAMQHRAGVNQAECLACHKPLDKVSRTFALERLAAVAQGR